MSAAEPIPGLTPEPGPDAGVDDIRADIEQTREQLGATLEALSDKVNVVARTRDKAREVAPTLAIASSALGVTLIAIVWWRRRARPG